MSLKDYVNVILVKYRSQLGTKDHTVCIRVIQAGAVDILMDGHDTPFGIRVSLQLLSEWPAHVLLHCSCWYLIQ